MRNTSVVSTSDLHSAHHVEFYEGESFIFDPVARFFADGLRAGQPLVLISTADHRDGIATALSSLGFEMQVAEADGRFMWLDARETLSRFMVDGMPDAQLFRSVLGQALEQCRAGREHMTIRAFGEMVDILLYEGNPEAALRLEELWNELGQVYGFSLLCAYSIANLYRENHWRFFHQICDQHVQLPPQRIEAIAHAREQAMRSSHIPPSKVRDFAFGQAMLTSAELPHFNDCDVCSELWWRLKQSAKRHLKKDDVPIDRVS
jgi:hypothetical protein